MINKIPEDIFWDLYRHFENEEISFFNTLFLISLIYFQQQKCDYLCYEAGIGGTNSITNILDSDVSAITSIGYDHQEILGNTIEAITFDKAGVIKYRKPVVIGATVNRELVNPIAKKLESEVIMPSDISIDTPFEQHNKSISREIIKCLSKVDSRLTDKINKDDKMIGLDDRLPCRLQNISSSLPESCKSYLNIDTYADVCHNPQGFQGSIKLLNSMYNNKCSIHILLAFSMTKDIIEGLSYLNSVEQIKSIRYIYNFHPKLLPPLAAQAIIDKHRSLVSSQKLKNIDFSAYSQTSNEISSKGGDRPAYLRQWIQAAEEIEKLRKERGMQEERDVVVVCGSFYIHELEQEE